jgi:oxygen-independent coproporphyrinogen-3 oxidase
LRPWVHLRRARERFAGEMERIAPPAQKGMIEMHDEGIQRTPLAWFSLRGVTTILDPHLQTGRGHDARFSRII